jgi:hypothetical protein
MRRTTWAGERAHLMKAVTERGNLAQTPACSKLPALWVACMAFARCRKCYDFLYFVAYAVIRIVLFEAGVCMTPPDRDAGSS